MSNRKPFESLSDKTKNRIFNIDEAFEAFKFLLELFPCRESALAIDHMETACMFAIKAFVDFDNNESKQKEYEENLSNLNSK